MKKFNITFEHKSGNAQFLASIECGPSWFALKEAIEFKMSFLGLNAEGWSISSLEPVS
jgi:hypothetical protein